MYGLVSSGWPSFTLVLSQKPLIAKKTFPESINSSLPLFMFDYSPFVFSLWRETFNS